MSIILSRHRSHVLERTFPVQPVLHQGGRPLPRPRLPQRAPRRHHRQLQRVQPRKRLEESGIRAKLLTYYNL